MPHCSDVRFVQVDFPRQLRPSLVIEFSEDLLLLLGLAGGAWLAADATVLGPAGGVAVPVVFVFHRPLLAADLPQPVGRCPAFLKAEDEVPRFLFCKRPSSSHRR